MSVRLLFPLTVFERDMTDPKWSDRQGVTPEYLEELRQEMDRMRQKDPQGRRVSNAYTGWQSNDSVESNQVFAPLMRKIKSVFDEEVFPYHGIDMGVCQMSMGNCWANINGFGAWNRPHLHNGCWFSGAFYIAADGDEGDIEFIDTDAKVVSDFPHSPRNACSHNHAPRSGQLLLFPSGAMHMVAPNMTDKERYSIAFNINLQYIGNGDRNGNIPNYNPDEFCFDIGKDGNPILSNDSN